MRRVAQSGSALRNTFGTSEYSREWSRRKKEVLERHKEQQKGLKKEWKKENKEIARALEKQQARYERRMKPDDAEKYFGRFEQKERREIQHERDKTLKTMELEKNHEIRSIAREIKSWK